MQSKHLWRWIQWKFFDIGNELSMFDDRRRIVQPTLGILIVLLESLICDVALQYCGYQSHILIVSDSPSVVDLGSQVVQHLEGDAFILVEQHLELPLTNR